MKDYEKQWETRFEYVDQEEKLVIREMQLEDATKVVRGNGRLNKAKFQNNVQELKKDITRCLKEESADFIFVVETLSGKYVTTIRTVTIDQKEVTAEVTIEIPKLIKSSYQKKVVHSFIQLCEKYQLYDIIRVNEAQIKTRARIMYDQKLQTA